MFRCDVCKIVTKPREKCYRVVKATRAKIYRNDRGKIIGSGKEIVEEVKLCPTCREKWCMSTS